MARQEADGLIEQTVRLVLDDVCTKVNQKIMESQQGSHKYQDTSSSPADRYSTAGVMPWKLVDYETTEAEDNGEETDITTRNPDALFLRPVDDTLYVGTQLAGSLSDDVNIPCNQLPRVSTGSVDVAECSDADSSDSSLFGNREKGNDSESSDSSSDSSSASSADEESEADNIVRMQRVRVKSERQKCDHDSDHDSDTGAHHKHPPKVRGEFLVGDLPSVSQLDFVLSVDDELDKIGSVHSVVETLVVVKSRPMLPPLDTDSVLWRSDRRPLGAVFETFGPVQSPYYSVRFPSLGHIRKSGISEGDSVFYAPNNNQFTKYVFTAHLMQLKGSDASWKDDIEPPPEGLDYSDDEQEQRIRQPKSSPHQETGRKRARKPRSSFHSNQRRHRGQTANSPLPPPFPPIQHHHQHITSSGMTPWLPTAGVGVSYPQVRCPIIPPVQSVAPLLPVFVKQEVLPESCLSSVFYRPPPPGHVESYQQCYAGMLMQPSSHGVPEHKQSQ